MAQPKSTKQKDSTVFNDSEKVLGQVAFEELNAELDGDPGPLSWEEFKEISKRSLTDLGFDQ